jgi:hypothetical protein
MIVTDGVINMIVIDEHTNTFAKTHNYGFFPNIDKSSVVILAEDADIREFDDFNKALHYNGLILTFTKDLEFKDCIASGLDPNKNYSLYSLEPYTF